MFAAECTNRRINDRIPSRPHVPSAANFATTPLSPRLRRLENGSSDNSRPIAAKTSRRCQRPYLALLPCSKSPALSPACTSTSRSRLCLRPSLPLLRPASLSRRPSLPPSSPFTHPFPPFVRLPISASLSPFSPSADCLPSALFSLFSVDDSSPASAAGRLPLPLPRPLSPYLFPPTEETTSSHLLAPSLDFSRPLAPLPPPPAQASPSLFSVSSSLLPVSPPSPRCHCLSVPPFFSVASRSLNLLRKSPALRQS